MSLIKWSLFGIGLLFFGLMLLAGLSAIQELAAWHVATFIIMLVLCGVSMLIMMGIGEIVEKIDNKQTARKTDRKLARMGFYYFRARAEAEWNARREIDQIADEHIREAREKAENLRRFGR